MGINWITAVRGIRYKEHPNRRHGKKPDRYWVLQYRRDGRTYNEAIGWWSEGASQAQAETLLAQLRQNWRTGNGPQTLKEMRTTALARREAEEAAQRRAVKAPSTFGDYWADHYWPTAQARKSPITLESENWLFSRWFGPVLGPLPFSDITSGQIEKILEGMRQAGKAPRTQEHAKAVISGVWNEALKAGWTTQDNPCRQIKIMKKDNRRLRFLTQAEARLILTELKKRSGQVYAEALLSLFTGLRSGEIFNLCWSDLDFENKLILVRDPKKRKNRHAFMTDEIESLLKGLHRDQNPEALVFPGRDGQRQRVVSCTFRRAIEDLGLNAGLSDSRQKVVFHSLRHTFASWLAQAGEPLFTIAQLLGHSSLAMTARYSHLAPEHLRQAAQRLSGRLEHEPEAA
jgi:integrase